MNNAVAGLCLENVHVWRGDRHVLKGVSLALAPGDLMHLSGPNGTGKSTLLRVATGLLRPERGSITWCGRPIDASAAEYQNELAYASHEPALKGDLTALENLRFQVALRRPASSSELRESLDRAGVLNCADLPARVLSAGQRRRVAMARVLAAQAAVWLLDEPYTNLDATGSAVLSALLVEHVGRGGLALVVAHHELALGAGLRRLELS